MEQSPKTVNLAGSTLGCRCHVCAFFSNRDDEYKIMIPFVKEGLDGGDRALKIFDKTQRAERLERLIEGGMDVGAAERSRQLQLLPWEEAHLRGGRFDQYAMMGLLEDVGKAARQQKTGMTRLWVNMEWALGDFPGKHDILEYESRVNRILPNYDLPTVCAYDVTQHSAAIIMDVLRTHPQAIVGGILQENPYYVPPDEFLRELRERGGSQRAANAP